MSKSICQHDAQTAWQCLIPHLVTHRNFNLLNTASIVRLCQDKLKTKARVKKALKLLILKEQLFPAKYKDDIVFLMHPAVISDIMATSLPGIQPFPGCGEYVCCQQNTGDISVAIHLLKEREL
jgi:hypothetical protein